MVRNYNITDPLTDFSVMILRVAENIKYTGAGNHLAGQIIKSGTSSAYTYGEAISGE